MEFINYGTLVAATDNDAYNTLVATDLAPEYGRDNVFQIMREKSDSARHQLPRTLGGQKFGPDMTYDELEQMMQDGWTFRVTRLTEEYSLEAWRTEHPESVLVGWIPDGKSIKLVRYDVDVKGGNDVRLIALRPVETTDRSVG